MLRTALCMVWLHYHRRYRLSTRIRYAITFKLTENVTCIPYTLSCTLLCLCVIAHMPYSVAFSTTLHCMMTIVSKVLQNLDDGDAIELRDLLFLSRMPVIAVPTSNVHCTHMFTICTPYSMNSIHPSFHTHHTNT